MSLEYRLSPTGLGTVVSSLSMLMSAGLPVRLYADPGGIAHKLKIYLDIPDSKLTVTPGQSTAPDITGQLYDQGKYFSPYFNVDNVRVFGRVLPTQKKNKPCVGLAMYASSQPGQNINNEHPHNRYYAPEIYTAIYRLLIAAGYDVITLNSNEVDLEHKIFLLNELCEAVVGYEGGIAHLAHVLKIPSVILPYHHDGGNGNRALVDSQGNVDIPLLYATHKLHIDRRTYFLDCADEIINWTTNQFKETIHSLHNQQGNNVLYRAGTSIDPDALTVNTTVPGLGDMNPWLSDFERMFIKTYIKELRFD